MFTVVIPFFNGGRYLDRLLGSIPDTIPVVIVDDLSEEPVPEITRSNTQVIHSTKKGYFTGASNKGIEACKTDVLIFNQDTYFTGDKWLNFIEDSKREYGLFGERAGTHPAWPNRYVHGTFMYIRRDVIDAIGVMDAKHFPHWGSTADYQVRACRKGFKALPVAAVPDFVHKRRGPYGSATQQVLADGKKGQLIKTPPSISVIITCYNYGRFLQDAVNSLIGGKTSLGNMPGQTFQGFEIIIVDDGSTDDSAKIGRRLADSWKGIHFARQENQGSAAAMNAGIINSHARSGHFIAPLDGDDMMEAGRLERMMTAYEKNPHSVIYDNIQYFANGERGVVVDWQTGKRMNRLDLKSYDFERMLKKNKMHKGLLFPKQAWEEAGGYPAIMNQGREDWAFNIALGIKGWCGVNTGAFDYLYRRELQNRTLTNTTPKHHSKFLAQIKELYPNIYAGERPMSCCGRPVSNSKNGGSSMAAKKSLKDLPGQDGMVILEYQGRNAGDETWAGLITGTTYLLGGARKRGYVDKRDAHGDPKQRKRGLLGIRENGRPIFKLIEPERELIQEEPREAMAKEVIDITSPQIEIVDPSTLSVAKLKTHLLNLTPQELEETLKTEQSGKNRTTAISAIKDQLNAALA